MRYITLHAQYHAGQERCGFHDLPSCHDRATEAIPLNEQGHQKAPDNNSCHQRQASRGSRRKQGYWPRGVSPIMASWLSQVPANLSSMGVPKVDN